MTTPDDDAVATLETTGIGDADGGHEVTVSIAGTPLGTLAVLPGGLEWTRAGGSFTEYVYWQELERWAFLIAEWPGFAEIKPGSDEADEPEPTASGPDELLALFEDTSSEALAGTLQDVARDADVDVWFYEAAAGDDSWGEVSCGMTGWSLSGSVTRSDIVEFIRAAEDELDRRDFLSEVADLEYSLEITVHVPGDGTHWVDVYGDDDHLGELVVQPEVLGWQQPGSDDWRTFSWPQFNAWVSDLSLDWDNAGVLREDVRPS